MPVSDNYDYFVITADQLGKNPMLDSNLIIKDHIADDFKVFNSHAGFWKYRLSLPLRSRHFSEVVRGHLPQTPMVHVRIPSRSKILGKTMLSILSQVLDGMLDIFYSSYRGAKKVPRTLQDMVITDETGKDGQGGITYSFFIQAPYFTFKDGNEAKCFLNNLILRVPQSVRPYISRNADQPIRFVSVLYSSFPGELRCKHFSALSDFLGTSPEVPRDELFVHKYSFSPRPFLVSHESDIEDQGSSHVISPSTADNSVSKDNDLPFYYRGTVKHNATLGCLPTSPLDGNCSVVLSGDVEQKADLTVASDMESADTKQTCVIHTDTDCSKINSPILYSSICSKETEAITCEENFYRKTVCTMVFTKQSFIGFIEEQISSLALDNSFSITLISFLTLAECTISHGVLLGNRREQACIDKEYTDSLRSEHDICCISPFPITKKKLGTNTTSLLSNVFDASLNLCSLNGTHGFLQRLFYIYQIACKVIQLVDPHNYPNDIMASVSPILQKYGPRLVMSTWHPFEGAKGPPKVRIKLHCCYSYSTLSVRSREIHISCINFLLADSCPYYELSLRNPCCLWCILIYICYLCFVILTSRRSIKRNMCYTATVT